MLFDLPLNPDLLEQRIGRLDRIGQREDIQIHVPYLENSAQEVMFQWYDKALNAFSESLSAGASINAAFGEELDWALEAASASDMPDLEDLLQRGQAHTESVRAQLHEGRDHLLELNSFNAVAAQAIVDDIRAVEAQDDLRGYMTQVCDVYGVEQEPHSDDAWILRPTEHMLSATFPMLDDGLTITFDRERALVREDMVFVTWESPIVSEVMEMVLGSELGNTAISTIQLKALPAGTLLVESYYAVQATAPKPLQLGRYLPPVPVRVLQDSAGRDLTAAITHEQLNGLCRKIKRSARPAIIKEIRTPLETILQSADEISSAQLPQLQRDAQARADAVLGAEALRLEQLQRVNPSVRQAEIDFLRGAHAQVNEHIAQSSLEAQAVRVIITT